MRRAFRSSVVRHRGIGFRNTGSGNSLFTSLSCLDGGNPVINGGSIFSHVANAIGTSCGMGS